MSDCICETCNKPITFFRTGETSGYDFCSEYCSTVTPTEKAEYKRAKIGDYCVYPCSECGDAIGDELSEKRICSSCSPKMRAKEVARVLKASLRYLPEDLKHDAEQALYQFGFEG